MDNITFCCQKKEIIRLEKGKFFWKGQEVEDVNKIYERFSEWMKNVETTTETTTL